MKLQRAETLLERFRGMRVAVVGDLMLDRYVWGKASRISQEAPVPVVRVERETAEPGGAANVLRNLAALGVEAVPFGVVGDDEIGEHLKDLLGEICPSLVGIQTRPGARTTQKTRVLAGNQQVVRIDVEGTGPVETRALEGMAANLCRVFDEERVDAVIVEDYAKGAVTRPLLEESVSLSRRAGVPLALDPHGGNPFNVKGVSLMTPNRSEAYALAGAYLAEAGNDVLGDTDLAAVVQTLQSRWAPDNLLVTLGPLGMALFRETEVALHVPTKAQEVFDVSGAGDTVVAVAALALSANAAPEEAATLANHAAGVVVGKVGTAAVYPDELLDSFSLETDDAL